MVETVEVVEEILVVGEDVELVVSEVEIGELDVSAAADSEFSVVLVRASSFLNTISLEAHFAISEIMINLHKMFIVQHRHLFFDVRYKLFIVSRWKTIQGRM